MRKFVRPGRRERAIGNNHRNRVRALVSSTALVAVSTLFAPAMPAQAQTWTALANSTDWFNPGNWNPAVPPVGPNVRIDTVNPFPTVIEFGSPTIGPIFVGIQDTGQLTIRGGQTLTSTISVVGAQSGSQGTVTVTEGSTWFNTTLVVGALGSGTLTIENGGHVSTSGNSIIGNLTGPQGPGVGTVTVTGGASRWDTSGLTVGNFGGIGNLTVSDGGLVTSTGGIIGNSGPQGTGQGTVTGGGRWLLGAGNLSVGNVGSTGTLIIANGGEVSSSLGIIGVGPGSQGTVTVTGAGSTWTSSASVTVGGSFGGPTGGTGTLAIADGGTVSAPTVFVANGAGSTGTLNIGAAPGSAPVAPGTLSTPTVQFEDGTGTLNFNHTATNYVFAPAISGTGSVNVLSGTTILTSTNTYSGGTTIAAGTLQANQSFALGSGPVVFTGTSGVLSLSNADLANTVVLGTNVTGTVDVPVAAAGALTGAATLGAGATLVLNPSNGGFNNFLVLGNTTATVDPSALVDIRGGVFLGSAGGAALLGANVNISATGRLELGSQNPSIQNLTGSGTVSSSTASATISVGAGDFSGVMTDSGSGVLALNKIGAGTLTLTGVNT
jgi:T5SS/PEP-CTERM-associated repeat protein/autotransporter-associated beta strand protein